MDSVTIANGATRLDPVAGNTVPSGGISADAMAGENASAGPTVGDTDLSTGTGSHDMALASAVAANNFVRIASGYTAGSASTSETTSGTTVASGGAADSTESTALSSDPGTGTLVYEVPLDQAPTGATDTARASAADSVTSGLTTGTSVTLTTLVNFNGSTDGGARMRV